MLDRKEFARPRRRWLGLALAALMLLGACTSPEQEPQPGPMPEQYALDEEALFPYSPQYTGYGYGYGDTSYGLLNARGEFVLEREYNYITEVYAYERYGRINPVPLERSYFIAASYDLTAALSAEAMAWDGLEQFYALVSPAGELLTGFDYKFVYRASEGSAQPFLALTRADTAVWLDAQGRESAISDPVKQREADEVFGSWTRDYWENISRQGPDVPEEGFDMVNELPDGRYWGSYGIYDEEDEFGKGAYEYRYELFSAEGERLSERTYNSFEQIGDGLYAARIYGEFSEENRDLCYLTDESGIPINEQVYDMILFYAIDPYLAVRQGMEMIILDKESLDERFRFELPFGELEIWGYTQHGRVYLQTSGPDQIPRLHFLDGEREVVELPAHRGYVVNDITSDFSRFLLTPVYDYEREKEFEYHYLVVDVEGNEYLRTEQYAYFSGPVILAVRTREDNWSYSRTGVLDWDGNELLGYEFTQAMYHEGNALQVVRGDWAGLIDLQGNWIYRESVFNRLD